MPTEAIVGVLIAGVDKIESVRANSLQISKGSNRRGSADIVLEILTTGYNPPVGAQIDIVAYESDGETVERRLFAGIIHSRRKAFRNNTQNVFAALRCLDLTAILDRRVCQENFLVEDPPRDIGAIALALVERFLDGEGITANSIEFGVYQVTTDLKFKNRTLRECFDRLSNLSGMIYWIDDGRDFHFSTATSTAAPIEITTTSANVRDISVRESLERYRNVQHVQTDKSFESLISVEWKMEDPSVNKWWYPNSVQLDNPPIVRVNGVYKTVGRLVTTAGPFPGTHDFYYVRGTFGVLVDNVNNWSSADTIVIEAGPVLADSVTRSNEGEIAARRALEGGSGRHEAVEDQRDMDKYEQLVAYADALLRRNGRIPKVVEFETDEEGLEPSQRISILYPTLGIGFQVAPEDGAQFGEDEFGNPIFLGGFNYFPQQLLIENITITLVAAHQDFLRTRVTCSDAELIGTNLDVFAKLIEMARSSRSSTQGFSWRIAYK